MAQMIKNLPAMQSMQIRSLGWADPLEKGITTNTNILAWIILRTEEPGRLQSMGSQRGRHNSAHHMHSLTPSNRRVKREKYIR